MYSLQLDFDADNNVTIAGLAKCWRWSRNKARNFLNRINVEITYPDESRYKQNQKGTLSILPSSSCKAQPKLIDNKDLSWKNEAEEKRTDIGQILDRSGADQGQANFNDINGLEERKDMVRTDRGQKGDRGRATTKDTNTNTDITTTPPNPQTFYSKDFETFWEAYPKKVGKEYAYKCWCVPKKKNRMPSLQDILDKLEAQKESYDWTKENGRYIPNPSTYINQGRWFDAVKPRSIFSNKTVDTINNLKGLELS